MKWEYKVVYVNTNRRTETDLPEDINQKINKWGADGWELIKVESVLKGGFFFAIFGSFSYIKSFILFFKRPG